MLFRGMLFALLAVCYPEYSRAVIAEDYQANRLITLSMKNISVADIIGQIRKTTDYRFLFQVDDLKGVRKEVFEVSEATIREAMDKFGGRNITDLYFAAGRSSRFISNTTSIQGIYRFRVCTRG